MPWNLKIFVKGKLKRDAFHHEPLSSPKSCCLQRSELFQPYFQCGGAMTMVASNWLPSELTGRLRVRSSRSSTGVDVDIGFLSYKIYI